jgi:DNA-binding NarL/FixJ family response regulator
MTTVVIVDDHLLVRRGIKAILEKNKDIHIIGEAADGVEAISIVAGLKPDVAIIDIIMPRLNGIQAIEKITALDLKTKIIVISMYLEVTMVQQALEKGADGYLVKRSIADELLPAIEIVSKGEIYLSPVITQISGLEFE